MGIGIPKGITLRSLALRAQTSLHANHISQLSGHIRFCFRDSIKRFTHPRIDTPNTHGTGCTLSSALASYLAQGLSPDDAVEAAIAYISAAIESGAAYTIGHGHGPVNHFWNNKR